MTKANAKSIVHRRIYLDYIGVKTFDKKGVLTGELRIVGLFTSTAYTRSVMKIPYLRSKAETVIQKSGFDPNDHSGKALINVLESYPRDELFQIAVPTLRKHAEAILGLVERPRVRALYRVDQFDRFVSVIVFVPRDRYDSIVREKIGTYLKTVFEGRLSAYYPAFPEGGLTRVHFIIGRSGGKTPKVEQAAIEAAIRDIIRTWEDALREAAASSGADAVAARHRRAVSRKLSRLLHRGRGAARCAPHRGDRRRSNPIAIDYYRHAGQPPERAALKIYHHGKPVALSRRVPVLENIGFKVISERTFEVGEAGLTARSSSTTWSSKTPSARRSTSPTAASFSRKCSSRSGGARPTMTATTRSPRRPGSAPRRSASCAPMAATCSRPASRRARVSSPPRSTAIPTSRAGCRPCSSRGSIPPPARRARSRRSTSRPRSRMRWRTFPTSTTTRSSAATST